jgi:hypothetical protein
MTKDGGHIMHEPGNIPQWPCATARALDLGHGFLPVNGHPDDDECTFRNDGTDLTYCGEPKASHAQALVLGGEATDAE